MLSAISAGFFLVLIGMLFVTMPGLFDNIVSFFEDFNTVEVPNFQGVHLPAPRNPNSTDALAIYTAVVRFSLIWAVFLAAMLAARFILNSPRRSKADNVGDLVFWFGTAYVAQNLFLSTSVRLVEWFGFWAAIIVLIGVSLIARAIYLAIAGLKWK
jgi:hypothetical protein